MTIFKAFRILMMFSVVLATTAVADCEDVEHRVPFHRTPYSERTPEQKILTRLFQIECRQAIVRKMRSVESPPKQPWSESCDNTACKQVFDYCNAANVRPEKFPICGDGQCRVESDGSQDYCFDVYKQGFGMEQTFCYQFLLGDLKKAHVNKCWKVKREKIAEASEERIESHRAEILALELALLGKRSDKATAQEADRTTPIKSGTLERGSEATSVKATDGQILVR